MKKIIQISILCIIGILSLGMMSLIMAEETDLFYYSYNIDELNEYLENKSAENFKSGDIRALEWDRDSAGPNYNSANKYIAKGEEIDPAKITHGYDEIWGEYDWTAERMIEFLKSENKADYLKHLAVKYYHVPMYYNGERTTIEEQIEKFDAGYWAYTQDTYNPVYQEFFQIDKLMLRMEKDGFSGYTPIQLIRYWGFHFIVATKDNDCYLLYLPVEESGYSQTYAKLKEFEEFDAKFGTYIEKQVMTVTEAEEMLPVLEDSINKRRAYLATQPSEEIGVNGSGSSTKTTAETLINTDPKTPSVSTIAEDEETPVVSVWLWLIPLCAVLLTATAVTICIIHKKKKV